MSRRLANEAIRDDWRALGMEHFIEDKSIYIPVEDIWTKKENLLTIVYDPTYPFKPPSATYNGENILILYRKLSTGSNKKIIDHISNLMDGVACMCCGSLLCKNNWSINNTIKNLLEEFEKFCNIKKRGVERFWSDRIASRYLVEDIPLHEYL